MGAKRWRIHLGEMVLIVASILLAFALDSWWDERRDRVDEQVILNSLHNEFSANRELLLKYQGYTERGISAVGAFLESVRAGTWVSEKHGPDEALAALLIVPSADLGSGVLNALISSGRIDLLQSESLRSQLARWDGVFMEVKDDDDLARKFAYEHSYPMMIRLGVPLSGALDAYDAWPAGSPPTRLLANDPEALNDLLASPELHSLLEFRLGLLGHHLEEYELARQAMDELLAAISEELDLRAQ